MRESGLINYGDLYGGRKERVRVRMSVRVRVRVRVRVMW